MPSNETRLPIVGLFVGGSSSRMGGRPKGLLAAPDGEGTLAGRLAGVCRGRGLEVVLVGDHPAYASMGIPAVSDAVRGAGPLGGLVALLEHAAGGPAIALSCDLPFFDAATLARLVLEAPDAAVLAPRSEQGWEPLVARYRSDLALPVARARLARGELGLQGLCDALEARVLVLEASSRALIDWDSPEDVDPPG